MKTTILNNKSNGLSILDLNLSTKRITWNSKRRYATVSAFKFI